MSSLIDQIKSLSESYFDEILEIRRHIHANPELSFEEHNTARFIEDKLKEFGFSDVKRIAETGVTVTLKGGSTGKTIALRADIDALPILEQNEVSYRSTNEGVMHACGHDVHTASLLGAAKILSNLKQDLKGDIRFIFQPGEEKVPGGASILIKEGILKNPVPSTILGQHVMPLLPAGTIGFRSGMYMASADEIYFTVKGKGGHAAMPESGIDPIVITSHIIVALQQIVSRKASPKIPSVLSFGDIHGEGATNVIPDFVKVKGTFRTYNEEWRERAHELMTKMAIGMAESMGATCEFEVRKGYPFLVNEPEYTERTRKAAEAYMGKSNVVDLDLWLAAEDFAYYSQEVDACFYRLGTANEAKGITSGVHTPTFNIDESALKDGMGLMAWLALQELTH